MPGIEEEFYEELYGSFETLSDQMLRFKVPFIIWANYDIPEKYVECTSINYLSGYLLEAAGLPLSPYHRFLKNIEKIVPSMSSPGYYSYDWNKFIPYNKADGTEKQWLDKYAAMVYNDLFDIKNRNEIFFKQN